jgi:hypothetical protein
MNSPKRSESVRRTFNPLKKNLNEFSLKLDAQQIFRAPNRSFDFSDPPQAQPSPNRLQALQWLQKP